MINRKYHEQVDLLLQLIPYIAKEKCFALKGGTAINLFIRDMPRLSVDIDLAYLPFEKREVALQGISDALKRIKEQLEKNIVGIRVDTQEQNEQEVKLICNSRFSQVKIEVNTTMRGHIFPVKLMQVSANVQNRFNKFAAIQVLSSGELFGGKICAALDRQHPRDLFDVFYLLDNEGLTEEIKIGFIVALLSHPRPINEVIKPTLKDQESAFNNQFSGMTEQPFNYDDYIQTRERLIEIISDTLTEKDKTFLLSFKDGNPDWSLAPDAAIRDLPAVQWKLMNIRKLKKFNPNKHKELFIKLKENLFEN